MVELKGITIGGFKNINRVNIEIDDMISLLSINSYGKSNCLDAIVFGMDFIRENVETKDRMMNYSPYKPLNSKNLFKDFSFEIECTISNGNKDIYVLYGYTFRWKMNDEKGSKILSEFLKMKEGDSQKYTNYISKDSKNVFYKSSATGSCNKKINIYDNELVIIKF